MKDNMSKWIETAEYLPDFLRDFHDQKDVFKRINEFVENRKKKNSEQNQEYWNKDYPNWVSAHVYVIDFFLWYMAICGYTLQKSRKNFDFQDLSNDVGEYRREYLKRLDETMGLHPIESKKS